jgi:hypothetical protein
MDQVSAMGQAIIILFENRVFHVFVWERRSIRRIKTQIVHLQKCRHIVSRHVTHHSSHMRTHNAYAPTSHNGGVLSGGICFFPSFRSYTLVLEPWFPIFPLTDSPCCGVCPFPAHLSATTCSFFLCVGKGHSVGPRVHAAIKHGGTFPPPCARPYTRPFRTCRA